MCALFLPNVVDAGKVHFRCQQERIKSVIKLLPTAKGEQITHHCFEGQALFTGRFLCFSQNSVIPAKDGLDLQILVCVQLALCLTVKSSADVVRLSFGTSAVFWVFFTTRPPHPSQTQKRPTNCEYKMKETAMCLPTRRSAQSFVCLESVTAQTVSGVHEPETVQKWLGCVDELH